MENDHRIKEKLINIRVRTFLFRASNCISIYKHSRILSIMNKVASLLYTVINRVDISVALSKWHLEKINCWQIWLGYLHGRFFSIPWTEANSSQKLSLLKFKVDRQSCTIRTGQSWSGNKKSWFNNWALHMATSAEGDNLIITLLGDLFIAFLNFLLSVHFLKENNRS